MRIEGRRLRVAAAVVAAGLVLAAAPSPAAQAAVNTWSHVIAPEAQAAEGAAFTVTLQPDSGPPGTAFRVTVTATAPLPCGGRVMFFRTANVVWNENLFPTINIPVGCAASEEVPYPARWTTNLGPRVFYAIYAHPAGDLTQRVTFTATAAQTRTASPSAKPKPSKVAVAPASTTRSADSANPVPATVGSEDAATSVDTPAPAALASVDSGGLSAFWIGTWAVVMLLVLAAAGFIVLRGRRRVVVTPQRRPRRADLPTQQLPTLDRRPLRRSGSADERPPWRG